MPETHERLSSHRQTVKRKRQCQKYRRRKTFGEGVKMKRNIWIEQAMSMGGEMEIVHEGDHFTATMKWPGIKDKVQAVGNTMAEVKANLNEALMEDCAQEM